MFEVSLTLHFGIYKIYEKVLCHLKHMSDLSKSFKCEAKIPVVPHSFGMCINKLEEMVIDVALEEAIQGPQIGFHNILILLYVDGMFVLAYGIHSMHQLLQVLKVLCLEVRCK